MTIDLFGRWQTEKYKPPPAKDVSEFNKPPPLPESEKSILLTD